MLKKIAIYPGSFDPITNGHLDLILRGASVFDELIVAVAESPKKKLLFSTKERIEMVKESVAGNDRVSVESFSGLLVDYVKSKNASVIIRGLRAVSDFEYELSMALMNRRLNLNIETFFMMTSDPYTYLSSGMVREIASLRGSVSGLVPEIVEKKLNERYS
ncbi:pantetheine-phosphate adenylyltransferase [Thermodesulfobacteriota bacterium]